MKYNINKHFEQIKDIFKEASIQDSATSICIANHTIGSFNHQQIEIDVILENTETFIQITDNEIHCQSYFKDRKYRKKNKQVMFSYTGSSEEYINGITKSLNTNGLCVS